MSVLLVGSSCIIADKWAISWSTIFKSDIDMPGVVGNPVKGIPCPSTHGASWCDIFIDEVIVPTEKHELILIVVRRKIAPRVGEKRFDPVEPSFFGGQLHDL